jgi:UDP-N-acetylglucosamine 2-epimerase (non-hydrolysing)
MWAVTQRSPYGDPALDRLDDHDRPVLLVTAHRRESWGSAMEGIGRALGRLAELEPGLTIVVPMHRNPSVRAALLPPLARKSNVIVTEPLEYGGFCRLLDRARIVLTDSGGLQEEAPSLGKPVLVMRDTTERREAIACGTARLVGTDEDVIVGAVQTLLGDELAYGRMANAVNPYGDGHAADRSLDAIGRFLSAAPVSACASNTAVRMRAPG